MMVAGFANLISKTRSLIAGALIFLCTLAIFGQSSIPSGAVQANSNTRFEQSDFTELSPTLAPQPESFIANQVILKLNGSTPSAALQQVFESQSMTVVGTIESLGIQIIELSGEDVQTAITTLSANPGVEYAEPNYLAEITDTTPNDPYWAFQYGPSAIHAPQGWDISTGSTAVTIAIVDTGVDLSHPELAGKIVDGYDFVNSDITPQDDNGHGTHVAGIAAAIGNNGLGVAGISWGARIMPVKALNSAGTGSFADVAAGIVWATDHGAQVINLSLGGPAPSLVLQAAVDYAYANGVVVVAAAGNTGSASVLYPARYPDVIAVAATDSTNTRSPISNYGPEISVAAPGVSVYSTLPGGNYGTKTGTSMSAGYVSGLVAVMIGVSDAWSPDSIRADLENTALDLGSAGRDDFYGYGLIQMDAAIQAERPTFTPTGTTVNSPTPTFIPTSTRTANPTATNAPQSNSSPSFIPIPTEAWTPTSTSSPVITDTPLPELAIQVANATNTPTFSPTSTASPTLTLTLDISVTPTSTAILLPSPTPTATFVITRIAIPSLAPEPTRNPIGPENFFATAICGLGGGVLLIMLALLWWARRHKRIER